MTPNSVLPTRIHRASRALMQYWMLGTGVFAIVFALAALSAYLQTPQYLAQGTIKIKSAKSDITPTEAKNLAALNKLSIPSSNPLLTAAHLIQSDSVIDKTLKTLNWEQSNGVPVTPHNFLQSLEVKPQPDTQTLSIQRTDTNPQKAATGVNVLMKTYVDHNTNSNIENDPVQQSLAQQLAKAQQNLRKIETALNGFKQTHPLLPSQTQVSVDRSKIKALQLQLASKQTQLASISAQKKEILTQQGLTEIQANAAPALRRSSDIQSLLAQIRQVQTKLALAQKNLTADHPMVVNLKDNLGNLKTLFGQTAAQVSGQSITVLNPDGLIDPLQKPWITDFIRIETTHNELEMGIQNLAAQLTTQQTQIAGLPQLEQQRSALERQAKAAQIAQESLRQKLKNTQMASVLGVDTVQVLTEAVVPNQPVSPNKLLHLTLGGLLGGILGLMATQWRAARHQNRAPISDQQGLESKPGLMLPSVQPLPDSPDSFDFGVDPTKISEFWTDPQLFPAATAPERSPQSPNPTTVTVDPQVLEKIPLDQLQNIIVTLQKDWLNAEKILQRQQEELKIQSQIARTLEDQLTQLRNNPSIDGNEYDRVSVEITRVDAEEKTRLLDATLMSQHRKISQCQEILRQHLRELARRTHVSPSDAAETTDVSTPT